KRNIALGKTCRGNDLHIRFGSLAERLHDRELRAISQVAEQFFLTIQITSARRPASYFLPSAVSRIKINRNKQNALMCFQPHRQSVIVELMPKSEAVGDRGLSNWNCLKFDSQGS